MVNTGRPSRGCTPCRRSRKKCDEARPTCSRCANRNVACEYKDNWSVLVRPQDSWAKDAVSRRVEHSQYLRSKKPITVSLTRDDPSVYRDSNVTGLPNRVSDAIPKQCQIGPEIYALNKLWDDFAFSAATCPHVYAWLEERKDTPRCLKSVMPAVALASAAQQQRRYDLMVTAKNHYGKALAQLAQCLNDPRASKHDGALLTAYLLGIYEIITHDRQSSPFKSHGPGRLALLRLRGRGQLRSSLGRHLLLLVYYDHLIAVLLGEVEPLEEGSEWMCEAWDVSPTRIKMMIIHDLGILLWRCRKALSESTVTREELMSMLSEGIEFNRKLDALFERYNAFDGPSSPAAQQFTLSQDIGRTHKHWISATSKKPSKTQTSPHGRETEHIKHSEHSSHNSDEPEGPPCLKVTTEEIAERLHSPSDFPVSNFYVTRAAMQQIGRGAQIVLLTLLLQLIGSPKFASASAPESDDPSFDYIALAAEWKKTIAEDAEIISDKVLLALGEDEPYILHQGSGHRASMMLFPLKTALATEYATEETKVSLEKMLQHIGDKYGFGMAKGLSTQKDKGSASQATATTETTKSAQS